MLSRRQSTRPLLSCSVFGGFSDNNKVGCGEIFGNWAILLLMTYTSLGEIIMKTGIKNENVSYRKLQECIKLQLAWEKWTHKDQSMNEVDYALPGVTEYMLDLVKRCFPRPEHQGYKLNKFHEMCLIPYCMQQLGSARYFSGQRRECTLKFVVKKPGRKTGKKASRFSPDLAQRHAERKILHYAMTEIDEEMNSYGYMLEPQTSSRGSGKYTLTIDIDWVEDHNGEKKNSMITG